MREKAVGVRVGGILRARCMLADDERRDRVRRLTCWHAGGAVRSDEVKLLLARSGAVSIFAALICQLRELRAPLRVAEKRISSVDAQCAG